jgi:hypothetical protein
MHEQGACTLLTARRSATAWPLTAAMAMPVVNERGLVQAIAVQQQRSAGTASLAASVETASRRPTAEHTRHTGKDTC